MQGLQVLVQNRIISRLLATQTTPKVPLALRLFQELPSLRRLPAMVIGLGFLPEHVTSDGRSPGLE